MQCKQREKEQSVGVTLSVSVRLVYYGQLDHPQQKGCHGKEKEKSFLCLSVTQCVFHHHISER